MESIGTEIYTAGITCNLFIYYLLDYFIFMVGFLSYQFNLLQFQYFPLPSVWRHLPEYKMNHSLFFFFFWRRAKRDIELKSKVIGTTLSFDLTYRKHKSSREQRIHQNWFSVTRYCRTSEKSCKIKAKPSDFQPIKLLYFNLSFSLEEMVKKECFFFFLFFLSPFYSR